LRGKRPEMSATQQRERRGRVAAASEATFAGLESVARKTDVKGPFFNRGTHRRERKIQQWLRGSEYANGLPPRCR